MKSKSIRDADDETWRKFAAVCKYKGVLIGVELTKILKKYLENETKTM